MEYSKSHQNFFKSHPSFFKPYKKTKARTNPEVFLGPNYETVLKFWWRIDGLTEEQWDQVDRHHRALIEPRMWRSGPPDWIVGVNASYAAYAAGKAAGYVAFMASGYDAGVAAGYAAEWATYELISCIENPVVVPLFEGFVARR
jgi:hypothetical protein